ncbi:MAG: TonB-dependent receptor [Deferribacteraceae bacterium]|jgi:iron complex outermembrane receptor protein|nr:TonB-dependent receptor [Deferribacteraceae bacterium]
MIRSILYLLVGLLFAGVAFAQGELSEGTRSAYTLPDTTIYGVPDQPPAVPTVTKYGTSFNAVTEEQIERQGALDFYDALKTVPGVTFQKKNIIGGQSGASLFIRGRGASHPSPDLNIYFDDVPRSGVLYGQALADGIPVYALGGMEIYKYPQPSRFGSGYGMLNFIPKYMVNDGHEIKFGLSGGSYGTIAENLGLGYKQGKFDIYLAQSYITTDGHVDNSAADQQSYYGNIGYAINNHWSVRLLANYVSAETEAPDLPSTGARPSTGYRFDTETTLTSLTVANSYADATGYIKAYYNDTEFDIFGDKDGVEDSKQSNNLYGLRARETFSVWAGNEFIAGVDYDMINLKNEADNHATGVYREWNFPNQTIIAPYLAISQLFGSESGFHLTPSLGMRQYFHDLFDDKTSTQAGVVLGYKRTNLSLNYAQGVNYPSPVILQGALLNQSLPSTIDAESIEPEEVDHYEIALTHDMDYATFNAAYFFDDGKNRTRAYLGGAMPTSFNTSATYEVNGVELSANIYPIDSAELYAGLTWLNAEATGDDGITRDNMPYIPEFAFAAGFKWNFIDSLTLSGDYEYQHNVYAGTSTRPNVNFAELTDRDKLPELSVLNLRLEYAFSYKILQAGKVYLAVDNVLDREYAYAKDDNGANYYMPGRTFTAGMSVTF